MTSNPAVFELSTAQI